MPDSSFTFLSSTNETNHPSVIDVKDSTDFMTVVCLIATQVLRLSNELPTGYHERDRSYNELRDIVAGYESWSEHGYENMLVASVALLYDFVEAVLNEDIEVPGMLRSYPGLRHLIVDALSAYQEHKEARIAADKEVHGDNFGDASGYYQAQWDELNQQFLDSFEDKYSSHAH